jgi:hypothetical protein
MALARHRPMERAQAQQQTAHGPRGVLAITALATAIALMDYNAPMLTLHGMTADFHTPASEQSWLLNGTPLGLAALLLVVGSVPDQLSEPMRTVGSDAGSAHLGGDA